MPPKLNKLLSPKKTPPKGSTFQVESSLKQEALLPLSSTAGPDPFAPKRNVLGAISPLKDKDEGTHENEKNSASDKEAEAEAEVGGREEERRQQQQQEADALLEAELILAEEVKLEEQNEARGIDPLSVNDPPLQIDTNMTNNEEEKENGLLVGNSLPDDDDQNLNHLTKLSQEEDEFQEATMLAAQEAKINQILNKKSKNHMAAYQKPISALSLDVPLLRAIFKDDIDTVKLVICVNKCMLFMHTDINCAIHLTCFFYRACCTL
jgi:hypothetical protein